MKKLINGCSFTAVWVSPRNWKSLTSKKSLDQVWYVACKYYDPNFSDRYPNGFLFKKRLNRYKTLESRKKAVAIIKSEMEDALSNGYNPILGQFIQLDIYEIQSHQTGLVDALNSVFKSKTLVESTRIDIKSVLKYFKQSATLLNLDNKPVNEVKRSDIKAILNNVYVINDNFSDKRYNKYLRYLSSLFSDMEELELIDSNPMIRMRQKKTVHTLKRILTDDERTRIKAHLSSAHYDFWVFINIYFHAGCRISEICRLKISDVDLENQNFKVLIKKGRNFVEKSYAIKTIAIKYWEILLSNPHKSDDYVFQYNFKPGPQKIDRSTFSNNWKRMVKDQLGIRVDLSSLRHLNLDEISASKSLSAAAVAGGHTSTRMVEKHYAVRERQRQIEDLKTMDNEL